MLSRLAVFTVRRPKVILIAVLALLAISIVFGGTVTQKLGVGGFVDPAAESSQVADFLDQNFPTTPNLVLEVIARDGAVENPDVAAAADRVRQLVEAEPAAKWSDRSARNPQLICAVGTGAPVSSSCTWAGPLTRPQRRRSG